MITTNLLEEAAGTNSKSQSIMFSHCPHLIVATLALACLGVPSHQEEGEKHHPTFGSSSEEDPAAHCYKMLEVLEGDEVDVHQLKKYSACVAKAYEFLDENGDFVKENIAEYFEPLVDSHEMGLVNALMEKCLVKQDTYKDTAFRMLVCFERTIDKYVEEEEFEK